MAEHSQGQALESRAETGALDKIGILRTVKVAAAAVVAAAVPLPTLELVAQVAKASSSSSTRRLRVPPTCGAFLLKKESCHLHMHGPEGHVFCEMG